MELHDIAQAAESGAARRQALVASFGARALTEGFDLDALLAEAAAHAAAGLGVERAKVLQHRPGADDLLVRAGVGWKPGVVGRAALPASPASPPGRALRTGRAVALEDVRAAEGFEWSGLLREHGVVSLLDVPVQVPGGAAWGVLEADADAPRRFGREHEHFLRSLAGLLGAAIRRLEVEAALREERSRAEALAIERAAVLDQLAEGVIVTDPAGRIVFVNDAAARIHGAALLDVPTDAYSQTYGLYTEDGHPYPSAELPLARAVLRGETVTEARWRIRRPDGSEVLAVGSARPVRSADGGTSLGAVLTLRDDTARAAAEAALRESEGRLRALADNLPSGMVYQLAMRRDGSGRRFVYISGSCERLTGVPAEAALADPAALYGTVSPEDRPVLAAAEEAALRNLAPFEAEVRLVRAGDGDVRWCRFASAPREMPDGSLVWDGLFVDITKRKRAVAALAESEALKGAILETALDAVVTIDHESRVIEWNPAAERTFGHAREAVLGQDMAGLIIPPELRGAHHRGLTHYLATGEGPLLRRRIEVEALRADGSRFPAELAITPTSVGGRTLFTAHLRDITERRQAVAALAESEARFHAVADNIPQLAWIAEPDGRRIWFNRRWYDFTGQTFEEARDWGWREVHHPEFLERVLAGMQRAWVAGESWEDDFPLRGHDGEYRWFLTLAVPVRDPQGQIALWFGTNTDVTAQPA